ncbi:hypothetical protein ACFY3J_01040 [Streptomyces sp. NPDC001231]|uniref:hypothetical protein n=1 Tax=Streptomyces sp. NPDC001231 TaxID=3364549 RepID=UPI0036AC7862
MACSLRPSPDSWSARRRTTTLGFTHAFVLTALLLVVVGALSTVLSNQQRDRARLGLVD